MSWISFFRSLILGDDRVVEETYVAGNTLEKIVCRRWLGNSRRKKLRMEYNPRMYGGFLP